MSERFIAAAGEVPARRTDDRWRQAALLGIASAVDPNGPAGVRLAAVLCGLDWPTAAVAALRNASDASWGRWWSAVAAGQLGDLAAAAAVPAPEGSDPDAREIARRLTDLADEIVTLQGGTAADGRFAILGHRARPERRFLLVGRSSATFLVEPGWDALRPIRLGPAEPTGAGNGAHRTLAEVLELVRRGDAGAGRTVPGDLPARPEPGELLDAVREAPADRDARLLGLAREVSEERERLQHERIRLQNERDVLLAERARTRRRRTEEPAPATAPSVAVPTTREAAADLLGVGASADAAAVEQAYRRLVAGTHPDRVADLDPRLRARAEELTVALNAARDVMLGRSARPARGARSRG